MKHLITAANPLKAFAFAILMGLVMPLSASAQHFALPADQAKLEVIDADDLDSVLYRQLTPFAVPEIHDTMDLVYHEPMPDSTMPRIAMILGTVMIQDEDADDIIEIVEELARERGANWIVAFSEPQRRKSVKGEFYYRSTATLMRVMDDALIPQSQIAVRDYREEQLQSFASVSTWYDNYGRQLGANAREDREEQVIPETDDY